MRVCVIGAGIAGLTCAYKLNQKGIPVTVLEKDAKAGGRARHAVMFTDQYRTIPALIKELGMKDKIIRVKSKQMGLWHDDKLIRSTKFSLLKFYGFGEFLGIFKKIISKLMKISFDYDNPSQELEELHKISLADWLKKNKISEKAVNTFIQPFTSFTCEPDMEKIAADYAFWLLSYSAGKIYTLKEDMVSIAEKLAENLGSKVRTGAEVFKIEKANSGFKLLYNQNGITQTLETDIVVLALPTIESNKLMPELNIKWHYGGGTQGLIVKGKFKYKNLAFVAGTDTKNSSRLSVLMSRDGEKRFDGQKKEMHYYGKDYDFSPFFEDGKFEVLEEVAIEPASGVALPGSVIPDLKQKENVYICGDFYRWPCTEAAATSGMKVAEMILNNL